jgi:predicted phosphohydrolase
MKIALYSDLHTEFVAGSHLKGYLSPLLKTDADVVVLAGDIASGRTNVKDVLKAFSDAYKHVIYVAGNHEYYGSSLEIFDDIGQLPDNVHFLNPGSVRIDGVTFIGGSLWTNFRNDPFAMLSAKSMISDFRSIQGFIPENSSFI